MFSYKNIKLLFVAFLFSNTLLAQDDLPSEQVEVIKDFEAHLVESEKLDLPPTLPEISAENTALNYNLPAFNMNLDYLPPSIRPIAMSTAKLPAAFDGYAKLGYGFPKSPYGEFAYRYSKASNYNMGVHLKHHSANFDNVDFQQFMENSGKVYGTYYTDNGPAFKGAFEYTNDQVYFYGFNFDERDNNTYTKEDVKQAFNKYAFQTEVFNGAQTEANLNYKGAIDASFLHDNYNTNEKNLVIDLGAKKWIEERFSFNLQGIADYTFYENIDTTHNLHNYHVKPSFGFHQDIFRLKLGANFAWGNSEFTVFPDIEASANIIGKKLAAFAGWTGDLSKNNFDFLSDFNPYILSTPEIKNTAFNHYYGGIRGRVQNVNYQIEAGYKPTKNLALYLSDFIEAKRFRVLYDDVNIINISGTITAEPIKHLQVDARLGQNIYDMKNEEKAWHLPSLEGNVGLRYKTLKDQKLHIKAEAYFADAVPYLDENIATQDLNALFDLSLGAEYFVNKNIGIFFDANNLFNNKRQRWYRYPTYGINILGGITARF